MSQLAQAKAAAAKAGLIKLPAAAPEVPTGTPEQLANLQAVVENAAAKVDAEKKEKKQKEKVPTDMAINVYKEGGQGRQPLKVVAKDMPDFLSGFYFASESARVKKTEAEMAAFVQEKLTAGKVGELAGDAWQYNQIPPTTMTGAEWKEQAPETVFHVTKGMALKAFKALLDDHFGNDEAENPLVG